MPTWALFRTACQFRRPLASRAKLPLPPSCPVSVAPAAYPAPAGWMTPAALPPENPPLPVPRNRPFQADIGIASQIRTASTAGGCVVTAVTRQMRELPESTAAHSIVVFGSTSDARLSQDRTGLAFGINGFGTVIAAAIPGPPPRPPPNGPPPPRPPCWPWPCATATISALTEIARNNVRFARMAFLSAVRYDSRNGAGPVGGSSHW